MTLKKPSPSSYANKRRYLKKKIHNEKKNSFESFDGSKRGYTVFAEQFNWKVLKYKNIVTWWLGAVLAEAGIKLYRDSLRYVCRQKQNLNFNEEQM